MNSNDYLKQILVQQTFDNNDQELKDLRDRRNDIDKMLRAYFWHSGPSIKWAGSMAKGTMILESYDGDMTCYFLCDEKEAGNTLKEIYEAVKAALQNDYNVECKASALRVRDKSDWTSDLHIDVVPGRYTDETQSDVFLHRTTGDQQRLKTNLQTHIDHIRDSGVRDAIRLMKLWKVRNGLESAKTFVLELLVVKLLKTEKLLDLSSQLIHVWTKFRDAADSLAVEDPANSNNDLSTTLNQCRALLSSAASTTLWLIENKGWEAVFGELKDDDGGEKKSRSDSLKVAVEIVPTPTKPWCQKF
jgi:hypothetical protein